eukprot:1159756-Pelagomonas_calceolata.AAC.3
MSLVTSPAKSLPAFEIWFTTHPNTKLKSCMFDAASSRGAERILFRPGNRNSAGNLYQANHSPSCQFPCSGKSYNSIVLTSHNLVNGIVLQGEFFTIQEDPF